jgi:outer membrane receptor protein involved in Fe transport
LGTNRPIPFDVAAGIADDCSIKKYTVEVAMKSASKTTRTVIRSGALALLGSTMLTALPALAQDAPAEDGALPGDIVVTATKRSESLQKVPLSIQALGEETLDQQQVAGIDDFAKLLPSVSFQSFGPGQSQLFFRGISSGGDGLHIGPLPATGLYLDETPVTTIAGSVDLHVYDIARIEALSGPQGTLFGASSLSGTLRIITNKPNTDAFEGGADFQVNKFGKGDAGGSLEGYLNIPLSDRAAVRAVGFYRRDGGYIDNIPATRTFTLDDGDPDTIKEVNNSGLVENNFNDVETYGGRAALRIDLDEDWTVTPSVIYQHQKTTGPFLFDPRLGNDLKVKDFLPTLNLDRWGLAALTIEGKLGNWDIVYSGSYFKRKVNNVSDYSEYTVAYDTYGSSYTNFPDGNGGFIDPTQNQILADKYTKLTQELRMVSPGSDRFRMTAGLFLQRQRNDIAADYTIAGISQIPLPLPNTALTPFPQYPDSLFRSRIKRIDRDYAAFTEASYDVTDTVTLTAGIRGFISKNTLTGFSGFLRNALNPPFFCYPTDDTSIPCVNIGASAVSRQPLKQDQSGETHKVNLSWQASPSKLIYATYSTGFRPGGNNRRPDVIPFKADTLTNYEIGWKTTFFDRRLRLNGAVFYEQWKDVQFGIAPAGGNGVTFTYNVGDARVYGIEGDFALQLGSLTLSGGGTYIDAKLATDFGPINLQGLPIPGTPDAVKGTRLPVQPKIKSNLTARYAVPLGSYDGYVQGSWSYQSAGRPFLTDDEFVGSGAQNLKGFSSFDFSVGAKMEKWNVELFIQNAFDKRGILSLSSACGLTQCLVAARAYPIKPQQFGLKVGTEF